VREPEATCRQPLLRVLRRGRVERWRAFDGLQPIATEVARSYVRPTQAQNERSATLPTFESRSDAPYRYLQMEWYDLFRLQCYSKINYHTQETLWHLII
jgi:hypothetical protein